MHNIKLSDGKKVYFLSDFHLGNPINERSQKTEKKIVAFLNSIQSQTQALFLVGDVFDFWFEYRHVVPKGYTRLFGKLAEFHDAGIPIYYFVGNHDMWTFKYFTEEFGAIMFYEPQTFQIGQEQFYIGHGDGLGPGDYSYKFLKKIFRSRFMQWLFSIVPPVIGMGIAYKWSRTSRAGNKDDKDWGDQEWLIQYCEDLAKNNRFQYYLFGHRHHLKDKTLHNGSRYVNLGDWLQFNSYGVYDGTTLEIKQYQ
jgi:UDP-2,3-diacylglucosamine hydrolase